MARGEENPVTRKTGVRFNEIVGVHKTWVEWDKLGVGVG